MRIWFLALAFHFFLPFVVGEARLMGGDLFLDGNTFVDSPRVDKIPFVYDFDMGLVLRLGSVRVIWRQVIRSREFSTESAPHAFGSVAITYIHRID